MRVFIKYFILNVLLISSVSVFGQCEVDNKDFAVNESIAYDLYFDGGLLKPKAGSGLLTTEITEYNGNKAFHSEMLMNTSGLVRGFYKVNDTLHSYVDMNLRPLYFSKDAFEGKNYSQDKQIYKYGGNNVIEISTSRVYNGHDRFDEVIETELCTYDFLSVLHLIRSLDYDNMEIGDKMNIQFVSGRNIEKMTVNYLGKSKKKANDKKTYPAINISLVIYDEVFKNSSEAIRASLTDDEHRIPIILDSHLKVGTIKAVMKSFERSAL